MALERKSLTTKSVRITFTEQQLDLVARQAKTADTEVADLLIDYLGNARETPLDPRDIRIGAGVGTQAPPPLARDDVGELRERHRFEPVSGKAIPIRKGEVLRIEQVADGQCVDFNAFNLHDYKEYMSVGHSRRQGMHLSEGDALLTNSPRLRPMFVFGRVPDTCVIDTLAARCTAPLFELRMGFDWHTNCQDTLAEAIREYRLTPDDVHDSCNMFMNTTWDAGDGPHWSEWNTAKEGDSLDLLACMDVLAVPIVCGSGDVTLSGNFWLEPIEVSVWSGSSATESIVDWATDRFAAEHSRLHPEDYQVRKIKPDRPLEPDPDYVPTYRRTPLGSSEVEVTIDQSTHEGLAHTAQKMDCSLEVAARRVVMISAVGAI
ncbi:MAG: DUF1989 domain-containing protein [Acidimicrobiia bacterium]|nr:DUF1989 domain-containing protein [Acidimicrobiia bacterium]